MIPYGKHNISAADINAVVEVLNSNWLTQGDVVPMFEDSVAKYTGARQAVATNSATSALHVACLALGLGPGDWLWTTPTTFVASANCGLYCGAQVDFVDIDPNTLNMSIECLSKKLHAAKKNGRLPKIVVPVHLCGQSCDMKSISSLSQHYGFKIIEDASHAIGGKHLDMPIGSCQYSDITVFSFHPVKIITTGEGGMALTNNLDLARLMRQYRSHGITSDSFDMEDRIPSEIWNYQQIRLGYNYRLTDIQAALGLSQMDRLDEFVRMRNQIATIYNERLSDLPIKIPVQLSSNYSSYHLYTIRIDPVNGGKSQRQVYQAMQDAGVQVNIHYIPVYRQPFFERLGFKVGYCPEAERYHRETLSLPIFPALTMGEQESVIQLLKSLFAS